jgi:hypothetical protein
LLSKITKGRGKTDSKITVNDLLPSYKGDLSSKIRIRENRELLTTGSRQDSQDTTQGTKSRLLCLGSQISKSLRPLASKLTFPS